MRTAECVKAILLGTAMVVAVSSSARAEVFVNGYYRGDGTYVQPYVRSDPDGNPYNNWSFPGNLNPYTGRIAPGDPERYLNNSYDRDGAADFGLSDDGEDDE